MPLLFWVQWRCEGVYAPEVVAYLSVRRGVELVELEGVGKERVLKIWWEICVQTICCRFRFYILGQPEFAVKEIKNRCCALLAVHYVTPSHSRASIGNKMDR